MATGTPSPSQSWRSAYPYPALLNIPPPARPWPRRPPTIPAEDCRSASTRAQATGQRKGLFVILPFFLIITSPQFLSSLCLFAVRRQSGRLKVSLIFSFLFNLCPHNSIDSSVCCSQAKRGNQGQRPKGLFVYFCLCFNLLTSTHFHSFFFLLFAGNLLLFFRLLSAGKIPRSANSLFESFILFSLLF